MRRGRSNFEKHEEKEAIKVRPHNVSSFSQGGRNGAGDARMWRLLRTCPVYLTMLFAVITLYV
jgi:hypothetical protein